MGYFCACPVCLYKLQLMVKIVLAYVIAIDTFGATFEDFKLNPLLMAITQLRENLN